MYLLVWLISIIESEPALKITYTDVVKAELSQVK